MIDRQLPMPMFDEEDVTFFLDGPPFGVILADPPWSFKVWAKDTGMGRSAESHYPTMSASDLRALPISNLAAKDCALFLWAVGPSLPEAFALGAAWGFTYKTIAFTWAKTTKNGRWHMGLGYYTRANAELCLLFTRGKPKRLSKAVRQLLVAPIGEHSAKPTEQYPRIERLMAGPYVELFARARREGWTSYGNEIDGQDIRVTLDSALSEETR